MLQFQPSLWYNVVVAILSKGEFTVADNEKILVVDDEADIRKIVRLLLERQGYTVTCASNGSDAVLSVHETRPDLIIMDIMMPKMSGIDAVKAIREFSTAPIIFLTARSLDSDKEAAYLSGGDDYLEKPFSPTELILKVDALLRRYTVYRGKEESEILILPCNIEVDLKMRAVRRGGEEVLLRDKESDIFFYLLEHRGEVIDTERIFEDVWGEKAMPSSANNVMVNMLGLRKKLEDNPSNPKIIKTVWGKGYRFD